VRQWPHEARADRHVGVEQVGEADSLGLAGELEAFAIAIERPRPTLLYEAELRLILAV
jgi:hypothetical protein